MYTSGLVLRGLAMLGLIGGPLLILAGIGVLFDVIESGGPLQAVMTIPEALWELSIGVYLIVKGYRTSALRAVGLLSAAFAHDGLAQARRRSR